MQRAEAIRVRAAKSFASTRSRDPNDACNQAGRRSIEMKTSPGPLSEIYNFHAIGERLGTAGQPTKDQFRMIRDAGFDVVLNLALPTSDNALADEGSIVTGLGMSYVHIPVDFQAPTAADFSAFCRVMEAFDGRRLFVH